MSPDNSCLTLHVLKAAGLHSVSFGKLPKAYVRIQVGQVSMRTRISQPTQDPVWEDPFQIPPAEDLTSILHIQVKHSAVLRDAVLGIVEISMGKLVDLAKTSQEVTLDLRSPNGRSHENHGSITIRVVRQDLGKAGSDAISYARAASSTSGVSRAAEIADANTNQGVVSGSNAIGVGNATDALANVVEKLNLLVSVVDKVAQVHPYLNLAWAVTSSLYQAVKGQLDRDAQLMKLLSTMEEAYSFADAASIKDRIKLLDDTVIAILRQTVECVIFIREYSGRGFGGRVLTQTFSNQDQKIQDFIDRFRDLKRSLDTAVGIQTVFVSVRAAEGIERLLTNQNLQSLHPSPMDASQRLECQPDTRVDILKFIIDWLIHPCERNILWLYGIAGCGKSTISTTIASFFRDLGRLGAFLFFDRSAKADPSYVIRTLAYQLGLFDSRIGAAISSAISKSPRIAESPLRLQFARLILEPLSSLEDLRTQGPIVIVLDALDECGDPDSRKLLLRTLSDDFKKLPPFVRIFITSRPQLDITLALSPQPHIDGQEFRISAESNVEDIVSYLRQRLNDIRELNPDLELSPDWPGEETISSLSGRSAGLFVWCSTAMVFVETGQDPDERLEILLRTDFRTKAESALDDLYVVALNVSGLWDDETFASDFRAIMGTIITAKELLYHHTIDHLVGYVGRKRSRHTIQRFGCVLSWVSLTEPVRILHPSFADFLSNRDRCKREDWFIDTAVHNRNLALRCLNIMQAGLTLNICGLKTSYLRNVDVPDLSTRVRDAIPSHLSYACRFWGDHLRATPSEGEGVKTLGEHVNRFLSTRLLYWLEALSLLKFVTLAAPAVLTVTSWFKDYDHNLAAFSQDAVRFITAFQTPISESAPHIYLSALPFSPRQSRVSKQYLPHFENTLSIPIGHRSDWPALLNILEGHTDIVSSVAFSHGGKRVVSGSYDMSVRLWNAETGLQVSEAFVGHTHRVTTVAFSPDGKHVASGAGDATIRIWSARTGEMESGPLVGHHGLVASVVFSPDGKHLASGSWDSTVRVWDVVTEVTVYDPLTLHGDWVISVAYSHDGKLIASASRDMTIRLWDSETGNLVGGPLQEHTDGVTAVNFSPDGRSIISGSRDNTIRIWDVKSRKVVAILEGHEAGVTSVAISPDGARLASGSWDKSLRIWDVQSGRQLATPYKAHVFWITSVAFSPDGRRIATAFEDKTIRIWDAETDEMVSGSSTGHGNIVASIDITPDGKRIASASRDMTARVWDVETGVATSPPFQGHTDEVTRVTISPDGKYVASGSMDKTMRVWDIETGQQASGPYEGHTDEVTGIVFLPDQKRIVTSGNDCTIRIWDIQTGKMIAGPYKEHIAAITYLALSPDGSRIATTSNDTTVRVWDVEAGKVVCGPLKGHSVSSDCVAFSPDGKLIASGGGDQNIRVWNAATGEAVHERLEGHTELVNGIAFSLDGKYIVSSSRDRTVRVWDPYTGMQICEPLMGHFKGVTCIAVSPDGKRIISGSDDCMIRVWDAKTILEPIQPREDESEDISLDGPLRLDVGWLCGPKAQLVLWIPPEMRFGLWSVRNTAPRFNIQISASNSRGCHILYYISWKYIRVEGGIGAVPSHLALPHQIPPHPPTIRADAIPLSPL